MPSTDRGGHGGALRFAGELGLLVALTLALVSSGHRRGLVLGSPWVLAGIMAVFTLAGHESWQRVLGGGHLHNRLALRLTLALGLAAAVLGYSGWGFMLPTTAVLVAVVHIGWSGAGSWRTAAALTVTATLLTQGALHLGLFPSVLPRDLSHLLAAWNLLTAWAGLRNLGQSAAKVQRVTDALQHTEARFRALVEKSSDVTTVIDADARMLMVSPAVRHVSGWDPDDLVGTDRFLLLHADDQPAARAALAEVLNAGDGHESRLEVRSRQNDGTWRWHEITMRNLLADPNVRGVVSNERDISERRWNQDRLAHTAAHDGLTGLPNRSELLRRLVGALPGTCPGHLTAVLFIDLDGFKGVNDTHGHAVGDALLIAAAGRLRQGLRPDDVLGRMGGDEFAAVLTGVPDERAVWARGAHLMDMMRQPFDLSGRTVRIGASVGAAVTDAPTMHAANLIDRADAEMYAVKRRSAGGAVVPEIR